MNASPHPEDASDRAQRLITLVLLVVMGVELGVLLVLGDGLRAAMLLAVMTLTMAPILLSARFRVHIPPVFQTLVVLFVFAALFLGEFRDFYERYSWWDIALHTSSGLLLGTLGFMLIYVLNEDPRVDLRLKPGFLAIFAFAFALAIGALWEVFEFAMDKLAGTTMQKPMLGDPSGLTDTMWDLIVDALGAFAVSLYGWRYLRHGERSLIRDLIARFVERNPRLFRR